MTKKPRKKKAVGTRKHPKHPGVVLVRRIVDGQVTGWRARYRDPDRGNKLVHETLNMKDWPTAEHRETWAVEKSQALMQRRRELALGASAGADSKSLEDAIDDYMHAAQARLRKTTMATYAVAIASLKAWAKREAVRRTDQLTRAKLVNLRDHFISLPKQTTRTGGKRGQRQESSRQRSTLTINSDLKIGKTLFNHFRTAGLVNLSGDDIKDTMKALPTDQDPPEYLSASRIRDLLEAAMRHDTATFAETRDEHGGLRPKGTTPRFRPITPFVAFVLLTGMRRGEALAVTWGMVDLDALDSYGRKVGEIRLPGRVTKTRRGRVVGLEVSPALLSMLAAMKLRAGDHDDDRCVFDGYTVDLVESARARLLVEYGAPKGFDWKLLRSTCDTYLVNAPGIYGTSNATFMASKQLGHSIMVAEKHYQGLIRGIDKDAHTLESAMQVEDLMRRVIAAVSGIPAVVEPVPFVASR